MSWQWMSHPDVRLPARFPEGAVAAWKARGWLPVDPPLAVDSAVAHLQPAPAPSGSAAPDPDPPAKMPRAAKTAPSKESD